MSPLSVRRSARAMRFRAPTPTFAAKPRLGSEIPVKNRSVERQSVTNYYGSIQLFTVKLVREQRGFGSLEPLDLCCQKKVAVLNHEN